jgi:hypothetical protein
MAKYIKMMVHYILVSLIMDRLKDKEFIYYLMEQYFKAFFKIINLKKEFTKERTFNIMDNLNKICSKEKVNKKIQNYYTNLMEIIKMVKKIME